MALFADVRKRLSACEGCRRRRAALRSAWRRFFGRKEDTGGLSPDFGRYFLVVEHIDADSGTATFRLNGREDDGYRLGLDIPVDWQGRPVDPETLIESMAAEALPAVRRELAGAGPPDYSRLKPLEGRKIDIAPFIERHYRCEDCRYG
ncbi:MAG: hypothetical protein OXC10_20080 [Rhodospirillaceae bacterium]|nr:hypothetical protein [Rhodospirillaceae bacterium]